LTGFHPLGSRFQVDGDILPSMPSSITPQGDGVLRARRLITMAPGVEGDALWWKEGTIRAVGTAAEIERLAPGKVPRYELPEALVTPGLTDGHTHFGLWALNRSRVELAGLRTREQVLSRVASAEPQGGWIVGQGWDANGWDSPPEREALDRVQAGPVYLDSLDVHAAWLNSAALLIAGITRDVPDPFGGRIVRDANGDPTGLLLERAVELAHPFLPRSEDWALEAALHQAQAEAHRLGLTGIHDVEDLQTLAAFQQLESSGRLRLRVLFNPPVAALSRLIADGVRSGQGSPWLTIGGMKLFLDGSLGSRTAWMLEPYQGSRDRGMAITAEEEAAAAMQTAAAAGLSTAVHAIGDAAVRRALDLAGNLPALPVPHRIEHFQCVHPDDLDRAASGGIVMSMQPAHLLTDIPLVDRHWGERGRGAYAFRSLIERGGRLVFGSDVPVASLDPREGIYAAVARKGFDGAPESGWYPAERLTFTEALGAYTVAAAHAAGVGHRRGRIAPGFDADLVAWAVDPDVERDGGEAFRGGHAILTVVGGAVVMQL
jgi:predicted amidohydrolase YtcJ